MHLKINKQGKNIQESVIHKENNTLFPCQGGCGVTHGNRDIKVVVHTTLNIKIALIFSWEKKKLIFFPDLGG